MGIQLIIEAEGATMEDTAITPKQITERILKEREFLEKNDPDTLGTIEWIKHLCGLMQGVKIRDIIVCDLLISIGPSAELYPVRCKTCSAWQVHLTDRGWFGCWLCLTDKKHADDSRRLLLRLQQSEQQRVESRWPEGMAM